MTGVGANVKERGDVRGDEPDLAAKLRIEERELEVGRRETKASRRHD